MNRLMSHPLLIISFVTLLVSYPALAHPSFDADDYRYARQAGDILSGRATVSEYLTITNTWETMWWYPRDYRIQYFRPTVILSFLAEYLVWGLNPIWYVLTNIILSVAYSYLAYLFLRQLLKDEGYSLLAALLFAVHPGHVSTTYYIAGLTDLLLGTFWLLSFYLYAKHRDGGLHYRISLVAFFLALLAKENAVTFLPIIILFDALVRDGGLGFRGALKSRYKAYLGYAGVFGVYYAIRLMLIPNIFISNYIYPYYFTPGMPGFPAHLAAITLLYLFNLTSGVFSPMFFTSDYLVLDNMLTIFILPTFILACFVLLLASRIRGNRTLQFLAAFAIIAWLPSILTYTNWRNLYLSTVGYAGILAVLSASLEKYGFLTAHISAKRLLLWVVVFYALVGAMQNEMISQTQYTVREMPRIQKVLDAGDLIGGSEVYVLNLDNSYLDAVFLEDMVKATYGKDVTVRVLTSNIVSNETPTVTQLSPYSFEVEYGTPVMADNSLGFKGISLAEGDTVSNDFFSVNIERMEGMGLKRLRFTMKKPLKDAVTLMLDKKSKTYSKVVFA